MFSSKKKGFEVDFEKKQTHETAKATSTKLGRAATTIATALNYHTKQDRTNPVPLINAAISKKEIYYGQDFENKEKPFTIPNDEITHSLYVGSTGTGKGVILGNRVFQSINEKKGVIIVDPKNDAYLPQICIETLEKNGRSKDDFKMIYFPNKFGYKAITERDTYLEISNKLVDIFNFTPTDNPGVDYYRGLGRTLLRTLMKMFFVTFDLNVNIKKDFEDIQKHIILLKQDLENRQNYEKELGKTRPNDELMDKFSKRFFNPKILDKIYFSDTDISTLDSLATKFQELTEGVTFENDIDIAEALYQNKVVYVRVDMNDIASLQWIKFLITDIIQNSKKKKANTNVFCDELSFYGSKNLAGALATVRSMGLEFSLFLQALSQLDDEIKDDIVENCNFKMFYKSSNITTLEYLQKIGGTEAITKISNKDGISNYTQDFEDFLNVTKIRSLPRTSVGIVVAEYLPFPQLIQTNFILTEKEFNWSIYQNYGNEKIEISKVKADENILDDKAKRKAKLEKYRVFLKSENKLLENSDLTSITLSSELII